MSIIFLGAFNPISQEMSSNSSVAGSKVQMEIISSLNSLYGIDNVKAIAFPELASWPKNRLFTKKSLFGNIKILPVINFPFAKRFTFSIQALFLISRERPEFIIQYNTSILMNMFMFFYGFLGAKRILILQDLKSNTLFDVNLFLNPIALLNYLGAKTIKNSFDFFIPISDKLIKDLELSAERCLVWRGGVTKLDLINNFEKNKRYFAVFAGALEEYNGVNILISKWLTLNLNIELHVFGVGRLSENVRNASISNKNIKYHGFKSPDIVDKYIQSALLNFCLRYSKGIDQDYFFPSKFFDLLTARGNILCNDFNNIPDDLKKYIIILDDDLSNLEEFLNIDFPDCASVSERRIYLQSKYSWAPFLKSVFKLLEEQ